MTDPDVEPSYVRRWFGSWKISAVILVIFTVTLVVNLSDTTAPLLVVFFPGAFIAMSIFSIVQHFANWRPGSPFATLPIPIYLTAATTTLFVAFAETDRNVYRHAALGSLVMTIPFGVAGISLFLLRHRIWARLDAALTTGAEPTGED